MRAAPLCVLWLLSTAPLASRAQTYFQQQVDHRIEVRLDDVNNALFAYAEFDYTNRSPDALDTLWIHLWPNAYRDRNTAFCRQKDAQGDLTAHFADPEERGFIDSLDIKVNGDRVAWGYDVEHADIAWIALRKPLVTGAMVTVSTPFHVKIPDARLSRLGHSGQAYYISQWYPKPAVYDNTGWHPLPYLDQGEFYSEFGSFDVRITLPANYVLAATGERRDCPEEEAYMDSLASLPPSFVLSDGAEDPFPPSSRHLKTIRFTQDSVHDFAWFADKRYAVRKGHVVLPASGRTVTTWTLFTPRNAALWSDANTYVQQSLLRYSGLVGDYRYASCTAVDGTIAAGGGMEYPMITIIGNTGSRYDLDQVIAHEVGHNWFYGMLASNERDHPWMDEGMNSFFEQRYMEARYPGMRTPYYQNLPLDGLKLQRLGPRGHNEMDYRFNARRNWDQAPASPSSAFTEINYGANVYSKTALAFDQLYRSLGPARFDACTQAYFNTWAGKHPTPADVQASYTSTSGVDLDWCFKELIGTDRKVDIKALRLKNGSLTYRYTGALEAPFPLTAWAGRDSLGTAWFTARPGRNTTALPWPTATRARIDAAASTLDIDRRNNGTGSSIWSGSYRFPSFKFLMGPEREDRGTIHWSPAIGYNAHDGFMAGVGLSNTSFPSQRLEWAAAPLYGFRSGRPAGGARLMWNDDRLGSDILRNVHIGVSGFAASLYGLGDVDQWYQRLVPSIQLDPRLQATGPEVYLRYRGILLWRHAEGLVQTPSDEVHVSDRFQETYHELSADLKKATGLHPFQADLNYLRGAAFDRVSLEASWSAILDARAHRVTFRTFLGTFLSKERERMRADMGWRMYWGSSDLLYDHLYTDRQYTGQNTAIQFNKDQGGFKTPTSIGTSDTWIAALNMEVDLPFALPMAVFASYGAAPVTYITADGSSTGWRGNWEAGIGIRIWRDIAEVWAPLVVSQDMREEQALRGISFTDRIRIVLSLEKMDPTSALRKLPH